MQVKYLYVDSCVVLAYFNKEPGRIEVLDQLFDEIQKDPNRKLVTSVLSITETARTAAESGHLNTNTEAAFDKFWSDASLIEFVDIHETLARSARTLMRAALDHSLTLKPADALHLASAKVVGVDEFFTYDQLHKFQRLVTFQICEPYNGQPRLFNP